jgi:signal transduction histidine kinase
MEYCLVLLLTALCASLLMWLTWRLARDRRLRSLLTWPFLWLALWCWCTALGYCGHLFSLFPPWVAQLLQVSAVGAGISIVHFLARYPTAHPHCELIARAIAGIGVLFVAPLCILTALPVAIPWLPAHGPGWLLQQTLPLAWLCICVFVGVLFALYALTLTQGLIRLRLVFMVVGTVLFQLCLARDVSEAFSSPLISHSLTSTIGAVLFLFATGYALSRYRLVNPTSLLRSTLTFACTASIASLTLLFVVPLFNRWLVRSFSLDFRFGMAFVGIIFAAILPSLLRNMEKFWDRVVFRPHLARQRILQEAQEALATVKESRVLIGVLAQAIAKAFQPKGVHVYLTDGHSTLTRATSSSMQPGVPTFISTSEALPKSLMEAGDVLLAEELMDRPSPEESVGEQLQSWHTAVVLPLIEKDLLVGIVLLGERESGAAYAIDDLLLLSRVGKLAAVALHNANHFDELRASNSQLAHSLQERNRDLERANTQLRQFDLARDHFLAALSHEMLTPLTSIIGWSETAQDSESIEVTKQALEVIHNNAQRQKRLVDDLLDISRISYGKLAITKAPTDLWRLVEQCVESIAMQMQQQHIRVDLLPPDEPLPIHVDSGRIIQVISNLLVNAMKFTPAQGTITISGQRKDEHAEVTIRDTGHGMTPEEQARIFELFHQCLQHNTSGKGIGLGLTLVKGLIDLHDGTVTVSSLGRGKGSTFTVALPVYRGHPMPGTDPHVENTSTVAG